MDITKFINSKDIAEYWKTEFRPDDYDDLATRYAWIIWQSRKVSLKERHNTWQEIIDTMPDEQIPVGRMGLDKTSLHYHLKRLIECDNNLLEDFYSDYGIFKYSYRYIQLDEFDRELHYEGLEYDSLSECKRALEREVREKGNLRELEIVKSYFGDRWLVIKLSEDTTTIRGIEEVGGNGDSSYLDVTFDNMTFDFPHPFKKGDILTAKYEVDYDPTTIFVLEDIKVIKHFQEREKREKNFTQGGIGYYIDWKGKIVRKNFSNYMDFEFYRGVLSSKEKSLIAMSNYLKNKINIDLLMNSYLMAYLRNAAEDRIDFRYTAEEKSLAGIKMYRVDG